MFLKCKAYPKGIPQEIKLFGRMDWTLFPSRALALNLQTIGEKLGEEFVYKLGYQAGKDPAQEMVKYMGLTAVPSLYPPK